MRIEVMIIDPQNDFCSKKDLYLDLLTQAKSNGADQDVLESLEEMNNGGKLYVDGAYEDSLRLADFIEKRGERFHDVHVTLDSHRVIDVAHPLFWINSKGENPNPFTIITHDDLVNGVWRTVNPAWMKTNTDTGRIGMLDYTRQLETNNRYPLCIWPEHCLIGTWGHNVVTPVKNALQNWERKYTADVDYVTKGSNRYVEHYSAVQAEVPDPSDDSTSINTRLIDTFQKSDMIVFTGQALSHCVANTVRDIANQFGDDQIKKMYLLEDTTSSVTGFENLGDDFLSEMTARGMNVVNSTDFLS